MENGLFIIIMNVIKINRKGTVTIDIKFKKKLLGFLFLSFNEVQYLFLIRFVFPFPGQYLSVYDLQYNIDLVVLR